MPPAPVPAHRHRHRAFEKHSRWVYDGADVATSMGDGPADAVDDLLYHRVLSSLSDGGDSKPPPAVTSTVPLAAAQMAMPPEEHGSSVHAIDLVGSENDLADLIYRYGEERLSRRIARRIKTDLKENGAYDGTAALASGGGGNGLPPVYPIGGGSGSRLPM